MKNNKSCSNCIKASTIPVNDDLLCRDKGAVSPDYVCTRHRFAPASKTISEVKHKCVNCENFILNITSTAQTTMGLCQLFSVRPYDGMQKNACSKFILRSELEIS
ncbi:MAG: hypothetical protein Q8920_11095 [Bacillota bacterium]|nr:hypothetical protein [Bacillota bacterium]